MLILKMNNEKVSICEIDLPAIFFLPQSQQTNLITFRNYKHLNMGGGGNMFIVDKFSSNFFFFQILINT